MTTTTRTTTAIALLAFAGAALGAPKAYISSSNGGVYALDATFTPVLVGQHGGVLNGSPVAISAAHDHLVTVGTVGAVSRMDPASGDVFALYQIWHGIGGSAITTDGDQLFVSDVLGNISYLDANGDENETYYAGMQVSSMLVNGDDLVIGSPNTLILSAPFGDPNFEFISACGGIVNSLALTDDHLFAGDANGTVYRFAAAGGAYETTFETLTDAKGVAVLGGELLVVGSDGTLERRDPISGTLLGTSGLGVPFTGIVVADFCFADLNADESLDTDDVDAFVGGFVASDLSMADCNGSGNLNVDDIDCFVSSFLAGCP
ncbi:MAG: hypothetical protein DHS20C14_03950 [Phycisphaeraceae bacterium]|nr:MAG: hypothetical protein DHS20C14_03950 [Phycisphaeraceae bacterium]